MIKFATVRFEGNSKEYDYMTFDATLKRGAHILVESMDDYSKARFVRYKEDRGCATKFIVGPYKRNASDRFDLIDMLEADKEKICSMHGVSCIDELLNNNAKYDASLNAIADVVVEALNAPKLVVYRNITDVLIGDIVYDHKAHMYANVVGIIAPSKTDVRSITLLYPDIQGAGRIKTIKWGIFIKQFTLDAESVFRLGDVVHSKYGSFVGVVTGFEECTNRVVCVSITMHKPGDALELADADRKRYAYKVSELYKPQKMKIQKGKMYRLNGRHHVIAVGLLHESSTKKLGLMDVDTCIILKEIPAEFEKSELNKFGITSLESM